jgi:hypothetical protein
VDADVEWDPRKPTENRPLEEFVMPDENETQDHKTPRPDPALKRLNRLVGSWSMKGRPLGSNEDSITGTTTFTWLHGTDGTSFFLQQDMEMGYAGTPIKAVRSSAIIRRQRHFPRTCIRTWLPTPGRTNGMSRATT